MKGHTIRIYLEIPLYILALTLNIGILCGTLLNNKQMLNPNQTEFICSPSSYPADCTKVENPDCRGEGGPTYLCSSRRYPLPTSRCLSQWPLPSIRFIETSTNS